MGIDLLDRDIRRSPPNLSLDGMDDDDGDGDALGGSVGKKVCGWSEGGFAATGTLMLGDSPLGPDMGGMRQKHRRHTVVLDPDLDLEENDVIIL